MVNIMRYVVSFISGTIPEIMTAIQNMMFPPEEAQILKELADEYDKIAKRMKENSQSVVADENSPLGSIEDRIIKHLGRFMESKEVVELKKARVLAEETGCSVCKKYLEAALEAVNEGNMDEALEWARGVRRGLMVAKKR